MAIGLPGAAAPDRVPRSAGSRSLAHRDATGFAPNRSRSGPRRGGSMPATGPGSPPGAGRRTAARCRPRRRRWPGICAPAACAMARWPDARGRGRDAAVPRPAQPGRRSCGHRHSPRRPRAGAWVAPVAPGAVELARLAHASRRSSTQQRITLAPRLGRKTANHQRRWGITDNANANEQGPQARSGRRQRYRPRSRISSVYSW